MRKGILFLFAAIALMMSQTPARAQGFLGLDVVSMPGYPVIPDTAYEGVLYNYDILIVNGSNIIINNPIIINLKVDSVSTVIASSPASPPLLPGDSLLLSVSQYSFLPSQYKTGNNIVVVWPSVNGMAVPADSFYADVYFIPLSSLGNHELKPLEFQIYPVPVNNLLQLDTPYGEQLEYVRIFDGSGRRVAGFRPGAMRRFDVSYLRPGYYIIEVTGSGSSGKMRFLKL